MREHTTTTQPLSLVDSPVSRSPLRGNNEAKKTTDTCGRKCCASSTSSTSNWVIGENVSGLIRIALDDILDSLETIGYSARAYCFTAQELGALFKGERIAIVASPNDRYLRSIQRSEINQTRAL